MRTLIIPGLLWFSAIGCGLIGGLYFAFSTFIMTSLGRIDHPAGIAAMNAINMDIQRSVFLPLFLATTLSAAALAVIGMVHGSEPGAISMIAGGLFYVIGMFAVTMALNVPLNDALAAAAGGPDAAMVWTRYLREWTLWNHVRTISSTLACIAFMHAIAVR
ncbi:DUF1772 domain-containing protein [Sphingomonas sp. JC676]|uniref:anthrone oxygenase family protein n=1 Tax=Sphingomonas sp. JC676 TaxID=2768065 RepID=UPI0016586D53|nr:anthrone oxygenase family protein [Sphingomonas sp. JC676]MBC9031684.1 DUF1772 domain-containing protein [Sphingomonas sp. JC676]